MSNSILNNTDTFSAEETIIYKPVCIAAAILSLLKAGGAFLLLTIGGLVGGSFKKDMSVTLLIIAGCSAVVFLFTFIKHWISVGNFGFWSSLSAARGGRVEIDSDATVRIYEQEKLKEEFNLRNCKAITNQTKTYEGADKGILLLLVFHMKKDDIKIVQWNYGFNPKNADITVSEKDIATFEEMIQKVEERSGITVLDRTKKVTWYAYRSTEKDVTYMSDEGTICEYNDDKCQDIIYLSDCQSIRDKSRFNSGASGFYEEYKLQFIFKDFKNRSITWYHIFDSETKEEKGYKNMGTIFRQLKEKIEEVSGLTIEDDTSFIVGSSSSQKAMQSTSQSKAENNGQMAGAQTDNDYESGLVRDLDSNTQYGFGKSIDGTTMYVTDANGNQKAVRRGDYGDLVDDDGNHYN